MCVDDYQFRHFSAKRQKICKRFVFRSQQGSQRAYLVNISQFQKFGQLCLCEILLYLSKKGLNATDYRFYMPQLQITIYAYDLCRVPFDVMKPKQIIFEMRSKNYSIGQQNMNSQQVENKQGHKTEQQQMICLECMNWKPSVYQNLQNEYEMIKQGIIQNEGEPQQQMQAEADQEDEDHESLYQQQKIEPQFLQTKNGGEIRKKQHEKTVEEALYKTKMWRAIHSKLKLSLKTSAIFVELSKKTLDDYFLVLRAAEYHGYNFKQNLTQKIGHLRAFIRSQPIKVSGRMPKKVVSFNLVPSANLSQLVITEEMLKSQGIDQYKPSLLLSKKLKQLHNKNQMIAQ